MKRVLVAIVAASVIAGCGKRTEEPAETGPLTPEPAPTQPELSIPATLPATLPATAPATQAVAAPEPPRVTQATPAPKPPEPVKAHVLAEMDGVTASRDKVEQLVMESHGLNMLLRVVQVELARSMAQKEGLIVSADDVKKEREATLNRMFRDGTQQLRDDIAAAEEKGDLARIAKLRAELEKDQEALLVQTLAQENMTRGEFDLLMETNAHLRKVIQKQLEGKISDENVREAFNNIYGENVRVRHIQLANMAEVTEAQRRLEKGESFETVARAMSRNASTRELGGELPPFSRETQGLPPGFKEVAFTLKTPGEVSGPVEANGAYHLIRLTERIPPKVIKFEDVKESVRQQLHDRWVTERMRVTREQLGRQTLKSLKINDPILAKQMMDRVMKRETELKEREQIARELEREREQAAQKAATPPAKLPTTLPKLSDEGTIPVGEELQPPATRSGSDTPDQPTAPTTTQKSPEPKSPTPATTTQP